MLGYLTRENFDIQSKFQWSFPFAIFDSWDWSPYDSAAATFNHKGYSAQQRGFCIDSIK